MYIAIYGLLLHTAPTVVMGYSGGLFCLSFVGLFLLSVCLGAQSLFAMLEFILG